MRTKTIYRGNTDNMFTQRLINTINDMKYDFEKVSKLSEDDKIKKICDKYKNKNPIAWE